jgi:hypothetical protein
MNKKWLATIGGALQYRLRRLELLLYLSLLLNLIFGICFAAMFIFGR